MKQRHYWGIIAVVAVVLAGAASLFYWSSIPGGRSATIRYGISPFQDTAMPVLGEAYGLYRKNDLNVQLVTVPWEDIVPSLASGGGTVDVAIGSINTFLPRAENIDVVGGGDVVFYEPFYVFKGASLMLRSGSGLLPVSYFLKKYPNDRNKAIKDAMDQLRGHPIAVPKGTPYEQMLRTLAKQAGMNVDTDLQSLLSG
jgi:ABC-type nitrate/sulfonate/bicarbonate transport system substrate-binding protein